MFCIPFILFLFIHKFSCCSNWPTFPSENHCNAIKSSAVCHSHYRQLSNGGDRGSSHVSFFFFLSFFSPSAVLKEKQHKATLEEQGHLVFMAFTKQLFEVELKEIWSYNNFFFFFSGRAEENESRSSASAVGGTDAMSVTVLQMRRGVKEKQEGVQEWG